MRFIYSLLLLSIVAIAGCSPTSPSHPAPESSPVASAIGTHGVDAGVVERAGDAPGNPFSFIPNAGQWSSRALYRLDHNGMRLWFADGETVVELEDHILRHRFIGARPYGVRGHGLQQGRWSFLTAADAVRDVRGFDELYLDEIYPGISGRYYRRGGDLKYELMVAPGADPRAIRFRYDGADSVVLTDAGELRVGASNGALVEQPPYVYQTIDGTERVVPSKFVRDGEEISFELGEYDRNRPLTIDPALVYSSYLGGSGADSAQGIALDTAGFIHVVGMTRSTEFPTTAGAFKRTLDERNQSVDLFVARFDPTGSVMIFGTYIGGSGVDEASGIVVRSDGAMSIAGTTRSTDFPRASNSIRGPSDGFIATLDRSGSTLRWSHYLGGSGDERIEDLAINAADNIFVVGGTTSADFPVTNGVFANIASGGEEAFVTRLDQNGAPTRSSYLGGADDDHATGVAVEAGGAVYVTGWTRSTSFPTRALPSPPVPAYSTAHQGFRDGFVTLIRFDFSSVDYSTFVGGSSDDIPADIAIESTTPAVGYPSAYITGRTTSGDYPDSISSGPGTWFVTRIPLSPSAVAYSRLITPGAEGRSIQVAPDNQAFVAGSIDAPGSTDIRLVRLSADGSTILHDRVIGGSRNDLPARQSVLTSTRDLYIAGATFSSDLPTTRSAFDRILNRNGETGPSDGFFLRYSFESIPAIFGLARRSIVPLGCDTLRLDTFHIHNVGSAPLTIPSELRFTLASPRLSIVEPPRSQFPRVIPVGDSMRVIVRFASATSTVINDTLLVFSNDPRMRDLRIAITAARSAPGITTNRQSITFPQQLSCDIDRSDTLTITNSGTGSVLLAPPGFSVGGGPFTVELPVNYSQPLPERGSRQIRVRFAPRSAGTFRDTLLLRTAECDAPLRIPLLGIVDSTGARFLETELRLPTLGACSAPLDTFITVVNTGTVTLTNLNVSTSSDFTVTSLPATIASGASARIAIRFSPAPGSTVAAGFQLMASPCSVSTATITLFGSRRDRQSLDVDSSSLDFGTVAGCRTDDLARSLSLRLRNRGAASVAIETPSLGAPFSITGTIPAQLGPETDETIEITYRPDARGGDTSVLEIPYLVDGCRDTLRIALRGMREEPLLLAEIDTLVFPTLGECESRMILPLVVSNPTSIPDTITEARSTEGVSLFAPTLPFVIQPGESDTIWIRFEPRHPGASQERVTLLMEPCGDSIVIEVRGSKSGGVTSFEQSEIVFPERLSCSAVADTFAVLRYIGQSGGSVSVRTSELVGGNGAISVASAAGRQIVSGDSIHLHLRFDPSLGSESVQVRVILEPCGDTIMIPVSAVSTTPALAVEGGAFGTVAIGRSARQSLILRNPLALAVTIERLENLPLPFTLVSSTPGLPATIAPGDSVVMEIEFIPEQPGAYTPTAQVIASGGCEFSVNIALSAEAVGGGDTLLLCITGDNRGGVGDTITLGVRADRTRTFGVAGTITYRIPYDPDRLLLTEVTAPGTIQVIDSGYPSGVLTIREIGAAEIRIRQLDLKFMLLAGPAGTTSIRLDSIELDPPGDIALEACTAEATITITDDCLIGGLVRGKYANRLEEALPNPADAFVDITYQQLESAHATLRVFDAAGREVLRPLDRWLPGGRYTVRMNVAELNTGAYLYMIEAGGYREAKRLMIAR